jgi:hypothetical protein
MWKWLKRWPVLLALLVVLGGQAVGLVFLPGGRVTRENCKRIREGMTEAEVRAILGKPSDDSLLDPEGPHGREPLLPLQFYWWCGDNLEMLVAFDDDGQAMFVKLTTDPDRPRSWLPQRVWRRPRARLGW